MKKLIINFYNHMGLNALVESNFNKAYRYFNKIIKLNPEQKGVNLNIGTSLVGLQKFDRAEYYFLKELKSYGGNYFIYKSLAELYYIWGKREKAIEFFNKTLSKCANEKEERFIKIKLKILKDKEKYNKILKGYTIFLKANKFMDKKQFEKSLELLLESIKNDDINPFAYNNIGTIYMNYKKDFEKAIYYFKKALKFYNHPIIKRNYIKAKAYYEKNIKNKKSN